MDAQVYQRMAELDDRHWWFVARRQILRSLIKREVRPPKGARILEIGCGTGHNLAMLSEFGSVEASELDAGARALAQSRLGRKVAAAALPDLSMFKAKSFDLIALLDVLEHVDNDATALAAIRTRLKVGGKLLVTVPPPLDVERPRCRASPPPPRYQTGAAPGGRARGLSNQPAVLLQHPPVSADRGRRAGGQADRARKRDDSIPPGRSRRAVALWSG